MHKPEAVEKLRPWRGLLAGWLLLLVITPLSQFLTIQTVNSALETDTPVAWAVGLLTSLVLASVAVRVLARRRLFSTGNLGLIYMVLALAVPLMNIGLVRQFMLSGHAVMREYFYEGTSTYRTAYNSLNDRWFPVVPTREGLAWSRADRVLQLLEQPQTRQMQSEARRAFALVDGELVETTDKLIQWIPRLSADDAARLLSSNAREALQAAGLLAHVEARLAQANSRSTQARERLHATLTARDEWALELLPSNLDQAGYSARERLESETIALGPQAESVLRGRSAELAALEAQLREDVASLSGSDRGALLAQLRSQEYQRIDALSREAFANERNQYVYRLSRDERHSILRMDGRNGPNQNLFAFNAGLWDTPQEQARLETMGWGERLQNLLQRIPWGLYAQPLLWWNLLFINIFLFLMCLAEWLRRKWVDRENLPFPLVEVADYLIRHDKRLETAGDLCKPEPRRRLFYNLFLIGFGIGFIMLFFQGLGHYNFIGTSAVAKFDFSRNIFEVMGGALKNLPETVLVLSPIVIGIVYLLSLEIGFSIWFSYLLYSLGVLLVKLANPTLMDSNWTGYGDGKLYPFPMEQMLGAAACFAVYHLWKARGVRGEGIPGGQSYVSPLATRVGLFLLPVLTGLLLWDLGLRNIPLLALYAACVLLITVALARLRAETGFPLSHAVFEFAKLPIFLGMTAATGAKVYATFINTVFLPTTLLFRTLPQQLENLELARRLRVPYRITAIGGLVSVVLAIVAGSFSFLMFSYYHGQDFYGGTVLPPMNSGNFSAIGIAHYPLWISHFLGENGLDKFDQLNGYRAAALAVGFGVIALLLFLRNRFMRFPLHPVGYLVLLATILYGFESPYQRMPSERLTISGTIWGSALIAWILKRLIVKYGGMNVYKRAKPLFVGLIIGAVVAIFGWNILDLTISIAAAGDATAGEFARRFLDLSPFIPVFN